MRKKIKKVSVAPLDPITGSIVDTTNIDDKTTNTYSAEIIDGMLSGWVDKTSEIETTDYADERTHLYVNEHLKLAFLIVQFKSLTTQAVTICKIPAKYASILPNDHLFFVGSALHGGSAHARMTLYTSGNVNAFCVTGGISDGIGSIVYPIA